MIVLRILEVMALVGSVAYAVITILAMVRRWKLGRRITWLLACALSLTPSLSEAAPSISSTSGTITHGSSITITGSSFGSKGGSDANKPLLWADFESSINPTSLGVITSWDETENLSRQTSAPQYGISAGNVIGTWDSGTGKRSFSFGVLRTMSTLYLSGKRRFTESGTSNQKFFRIWADTGSDTLNITVNGGMVYDEFCTTQSGRFQGVTLPANAWEMHEFLWQQSTSNDVGKTSGNGYIEFIQNGNQAQLIDTLCTDIAANYGQGNKLRVFDNFTDSAALQPDGTNVYMDDFYLDDTWARVIIGNASTLAASTTREVQIPSAWSSTSITATVNRGSFGPSASAYLYVVDSNNVVNTTGYAITFGSGGGGGGGGASQSVVLFIEWAMVISGVLYHFRKPLLGAILVASSASVSMATVTTEHTKKIATRTAINTLQTVSSLIERMKS